MAVSTYTSSVYANQPVRSKVYGFTEVSGKMSSAGTVGDVLFLAKVPHGAKIVDFKEYHTSGETALALSFGFNKGIVAGGAGNHSCLISSGAIATNNRMSMAPLTGQATISLSDTDPVRFATLVAKPESGTATISYTVAFSLIYRMDEAG